MTTEISSIFKTISYEIYSLVWVDSQANNLPEYIILQEKLRNIINDLKIFENINQYEQYIQSISNYDRIILIINSQFAPKIIPRIHSLRQIISIYIYGKDNEQWEKQYSKIKHVVLSSDEFLTEIQSVQHKIDELFAFSIFKPNINQDQSPTFIYFQFLIDCLLQMELNFLNQNQLIPLLREIYKTNKIQLDIIDEFERTYSSNQALDWYKRNTCFSKILNKALCIQNIDILFLFRFFLRDIHQQIKQKQYSSIIRLYQNQFLTNDELELFKNSIGAFISINSFFSTKITRQFTLSNCDHFILTQNLQRILFEIDVDPQLDNIKPFSGINSDEILFMPGSIFRVIDIQFNDNQFWIIRIKLCSVNNENLKPIFDYMKSKIGYDDKQINFITFGNVLWKMDKLDQAEKYYLHIIDLLPHDHSDRANLYYNLGHIYSDKNDYDSSLKFYNKSLEIWMKSNDSNLANNYNAIATNYWKKENYKKAYESFTKALEMFKQAFGEDHISVAMCLNNMGTIISNEKNYSKALDYYLKALILFQKHLSMNHPNLGSLHSNISTMYKNLNQIDSALEHLNLSLEIYEKSFPLNHSNIPIMLKNIAFLYEQKKDFEHALNCYEKISNIYRQTLTSTDPIFIQNEEKIQFLLSKFVKELNYQAYNASI